MTKIYIAGKVTGENLAECRYKFAVMQESLENRGFEVVNPMEVVKDPATPWQDAMDLCFAALAECDAIYMMPCSVHSKGAQLELEYALDKNFLIYHELQNVEA
ncbi:MAG: DUF4406 domain-containing protein [Flavobacterium sp.]|nr:DUF4406 domain-containing protein [Flavobacterium sp.]